MVQEKNQVSGTYSSKETMLEKLTEHYEWTLKMDNGGHAVGFYSKIPEKVQSEYIFPKGRFTLRRVEGRFCRWDYDPITTIK